ncbi:capsid assembly scaffolding protein Gp46 family protein [Clostridium butanoliproducens]|uniref:capsid assembly scaffolding protein Gp46 family protein n=1 Tax=Clostridium butanoliproducens TaxID=2991837 RepID=UPI0024BB1DFD|nr:DUF4355 domain-containing protein [Clostridium butanoliproducens]
MGNLNNTEETLDTQQDTQNNENEFDINKVLENEQFKTFIQSYSDKRVSEAIKTNEKKWQSKLEDEKKKANMTAEELQTEKERELVERERKIQEYELKLNKIDYFKEKGYSLDLADYVTGSSIEDISENADKLNEVINKLVESKVQERIKNNSHTPPKAGNSINTNSTNDFISVIKENQAKR